MTEFLILLAVPFMAWAYGWWRGGHGIDPDSFYGKWYYASRE